MPASLVDLNDDVLLTLVSFLDSSSARQLSQTARAVHITAKYRALESVTLTSFEKTGHFCEYMLKDMPHRLFALRELRMFTRLPEPLPDAVYYYISVDAPRIARVRREARLLTSLLANTPNLRVLVMYSAEYWMALVSGLADVLASLRHLQEIELENAGALTGKFINRMHAQPRSLAFLNEQWLPSEVQVHLVLHRTLCMPSVEYLAAYDPVHQSGDVRDFARSFPKVKRFDILRMPMFMRRREAGIKVDWPSLERVRGSVFSFDWSNKHGVHLLELINRLSTVEINARPSTRRLSEESVGPIACTSAIPAVHNVQPVALIIHMDVTAEWVHLEPIVKRSTRLRYLAVALDDIQRPDVKVDWWWVSVQRNTLMKATLLSPCACIRPHFATGSSIAISPVLKSVFLTRASQRMAAR